MTVRDLIQELLLNSKLDDEIEIRDCNGDWSNTIIIVCDNNNSRKIVRLDAEVEASKLKI